MCTGTLGWWGGEGVVWWGGVGGGGGGVMCTATLPVGGVGGRGSDVYRHTRRWGGGGGHRVTGQIRAACMAWCAPRRVTRYDGHTVRLTGKMTG